MLDPDREQPPVAAHHRCSAQMRCEGGTIECRRHGQQPQIRAQRLLDFQAQGEPEIGVQGALVEFVEDHGTIGSQAGVALQVAGEQPLGDHLDPRRAADLPVEAHGVADGFAHRLAQQLGHARGRRPRCQPARLEHQDPPPGEPRLGQQMQRHQRGLAGARRRLQHGGRAGGQGAAQIGQHRLDGQAGDGWGGHGRPVDSGVRP